MDAVQETYTAALINSKPQCRLAQIIRLRFVSFNQTAGLLVSAPDYPRCKIETGRGRRKASITSVAKVF